MWFSAPGQSQYFVPIELLTGTVGSTVRLALCAQFDGDGPDRQQSLLRLGARVDGLQHGHQHASASRTRPSRAWCWRLRPTTQQCSSTTRCARSSIIYSGRWNCTATFGGMGDARRSGRRTRRRFTSPTAPQPEPGHTDTLYVYNVNTGWTTYRWLSRVRRTWRAQSTWPSWFPAWAHISAAIPLWRTHGAPRERWATTPAWSSIRRATRSPPDRRSGGHDRRPAHPWRGLCGRRRHAQRHLCDDSGECQLTALRLPCPVSSTGALSPLMIKSHAQPAPDAHFKRDRGEPGCDFAGVGHARDSSVVDNAEFRDLQRSDSRRHAAVLHAGYWQPERAGTVGYVTLNGAVGHYRPVAGAFSPDDTLFFVSTAGDNLIHYINTQTLTDTQQISPNLPRVHARLRSGLYSYHAANEPSSGDCHCRQAAFHDVAAR